MCAGIENLVKTLFFILAQLAHETIKLHDVMIGSTLTHK